MFFFFVFIPASFFYLAIALLCISSIAKGIALVTKGSAEKDTVLAKRGMTTLVIAVLGLAISSWLYFDYIWVW
ncbi:MAG: hypothetical protein JST23_00500 [Bacteroidetes bacterium]|nr:hypothetical protein [Bacteroidota bacterium]